MARTLFRSCSLWNWFLIEVESLETGCGQAGSSALSASRRSSSTSPSKSDASNVMFPRVCRWVCLASEVQCLIWCVLITVIVPFEAKNSDGQTLQAQISKVGRRGGVIIFLSNKVKAVKNTHCVFMSVHVTAYLYPLLIWEQKQSGCLCSPNYL